MSVSVSELCASQALEYQEFILRDPHTLFYASLAYRTLLQELLDAESVYLVARDERQRVCGILPAFVLQPVAHAPVINSLPFFGSNGGIIARDNSGETTRGLLASFNALAERRGCVSSTIITSPFVSDLSAYEQCSGYHFKDARTGQITVLPNDASDAGTALMAMFHPKCRNAIRKAQRLPLRVDKRFDSEAVRFISDTHRANLREIGGLAKSPKFFELVRLRMQAGPEFAIYLASMRERPVAGILLFYFNRTVEYFTPVIEREYRSSQALSLAIFEAMQDATQAGYRFWNWGGTWATQDGVYDFKSRWGTTDYPYYYFTRVLDRSVLENRPADLAARYPNSYVVPYSALVDGNKN
jgi:hypothetical protein